MVSYKIRQTVQLLSHQAAFVPPPRYLAIHEVEEKTKGHESQRDPHLAQVFRGAEAVAHCGQDGHEAAETCQ